MCYPKVKLCINGSIWIPSKPYVHLQVSPERVGVFQYPDLVPHLLFAIDQPLSSQQAVNNSLVPITTHLCTIIRSCHTLRYAQF